MIVRRWAGRRTTAIAADLGCYPQAVRERLVRFNAEGLDGLGDRPGAGRKRRMTEAERSAVLALMATPPPGRLSGAEANLLLHGDASIDRLSIETLDHHLSNARCATGRRRTRCPAAPSSPPGLTHHTEGWVLKRAPSPCRRGPRRAWSPPRA